MQSDVRILRGYERWRSRAYQWRCELPVAARVVLACSMAMATGLLAQVRVPLPFTPVPVTGQVLAVLLAGTLLGRFYAGMSQAIYVAVGAAGVPWFTGMQGGLGALGGVTGGYLVGFVVAAEMIGYVNDRYVAARRFWPQLGVMLAAVALIYACGALQLALVLRVGAARALALGVAPFVAADAGKAVVAAALSSVLLPRGA